MLPNSQWAKREINEKQYHEMNENENSVPKSGGHGKNSYKKEVYSNTGLPQETRKTSDKQSNFTPKGTEKRRTNKAQNQYKKENN